jgi:hypothetical protein
MTAGAVFFSISKRVLDTWRPTTESGPHENVSF